MSDEITTTERLRALLDKRGVEWKALSDRQEGEFTITATRWHDSEGGLLTMCICEPDGSIWDFFWYPTPEQAVDATLGRGTCRRVLYKPTGVLVCSECGAGMPRQLDKYCYLHFCPNCGRMVECEQ